VCSDARSELRRSRYDDPFKETAMARGQIRAEYVKDDDYTAQQSPRSQDDSSQYDTRYGCGFDAPCRILAGVILGFGDLVSPSYSRTRSGDNNQTRSDSGSRRDGELFGCLDYDFGFRASSSGGSARGGAQRSQASFEVDSRSDRSDTGDTRSRQDISSDRGTE
jgi:hypothetical protein